jgi:hypothetical protein
MSAGCRYGGFEILSSGKTKNANSARVTTSESRAARFPRPTARMNRRTNSSRLRGPSSVAGVSRPTRKRRNASSGGRRLSTTRPGIAPPDRVAPLPCEEAGRSHDSNRQNSSAAPTRAALRAISSARTWSNPATTLRLQALPHPIRSYRSRCCQSTTALSRPLPTYPRTLPCLPWLRLNPRRASNRTPPRWSTP